MDGPRPGRRKSGMTAPLRRQQQVGERQASDVCTSPASLPSTDTLPDGEGKDTGSWNYRASLFSRVWVVGKNCQRISYTRGGLGTVPSSTPTPLRLFLPAFQSHAARTAKSVVVEGAGPLPFCSTKSPSPPHALSHPPTLHCKHWAEQCPTQPLFVQRGAGEANTHN